MKLDKIILSVDDNPTYYQLLPLVYAAYKKFFPEAKIVLAFVNTSDNLSLNYKFEHYCDKLSTYTYKIFKGVPHCNLGKMARYFEAMKYPKDICMINDADLIPLQREYYIERLKQRKENELLAVGSNVYKNTKNKDKFPIAYMTAEGKIFQQLMNPKKYSWTMFIIQYFHVDFFDGKEDVSKPFKIFSDESLIRALLRMNTAKIKVRHTDKTFIPGKHSVVRWAKLNTIKLMKGRYIEAHHICPIKKHMNKINWIAKYLNVKMDIL